MNKLVYNTVTFRLIWLYKLGFRARIKWIPPNKILTKFLSLSLGKSPKERMPAIRFHAIWLAHLPLRIILSAESVHLKFQQEDRILVVVVGSYILSHLA